MARGQSCGLGERQLRPYRAEDEPAVLALWARALQRWPMSAEGFRSRTAGTEQLVMVAGGALVGYISVARAETRAQLTAILVDPACRRAGLGSELLAEARRNLGGGVNSWSAGSGAGPDFWPGVPEDAPDGWAFLHAHGFEPTGEMADLIALKAPWLPLARTDAERVLFARIRSALDPSATLNPNVLPRLPGHCSRDDSTRAAGRCTC